MTLEEFLNKLGITASLNRIKTINIAKSRDINYAGSMYAWFNQYMYSSRYCIEFKVINPKIDVTEEFFIPNTLHGMSANFSYLVGACSRNCYNPHINQMILSKLKNLFANDFSAFLHCLLIKQIEENQDINLLSLAMTEIPETSKDTIMLILGKKDIYPSVRNSAINHKAIRELAAFQ